MGRCYLWQKVRKVVKCVICGKDILRSDNRLKIRPNPICSKECRKKLQHNLSYNPNTSSAAPTTTNPQVICAGVNLK